MQLIPRIYNTTLKKTASHYRDWVICHLQTWSPTKTSRQCGYRFGDWANSGRYPDTVSGMGKYLLASCHHCRGNRHNYIFIPARDLPRSSRKWESGSSVMELMRTSTGPARNAQARPRHPNYLHTTSRDSPNSQNRSSVIIMVSSFEDRMGYLEWNILSPTVVTYYLQCQEKHPSSRESQRLDMWIFQLVHIKVLVVTMSK